MAAYPAELEEHWQAGEERLLIRPIRPTDAPAHLAFFRRLSPEDIRFRFFAPVRELSAAQLARFTEVDYTREMALIAVREATGETVGVARLACADEGTLAEFAVIVQRDMQGHGLATHLMQRLIDWARKHGVHELFGQILAENAHMLELARFLGFALHHLPSDPSVIEARLALATPLPA
jgi:acetyltransferase